MKSQLLMLPLLLLLSSCTSEESLNCPLRTYDEVKESIIDWENIFLVSKESYYLYVFARTCLACNEIKNEMIEYAIYHDDFFLIDADKCALYGKDVNETIGTNNVNDLFIYGTPSLIKIENSLVNLNIFGVSKILAYFNIKKC